MEWWNQLVRGLGTSNAPFGFAPVDSPSQGQVDPAYNAGMQMLGNVGMGMLASGEKNPMTALGKSYLVASQNAQQQNKDQYVAAKMLEEADAKKQERARSEEERKRRQDFIKTLPPDQQMKAMSVPGYLEKLIEATDPAFQQPQEQKRYNVGGALVDENGNVIYQGAGEQGNNLPKGYRMKADGSGAEPIPGVSLPGTQMRLTEQQSKDLVYYQRGESSLAKLDQNEAALTNPKDAVADYLPGGNYLTSNEYQLASQAGREFLAAILRKDTGAAITKDEMSTYGRMYLPQPGDGADVLAQKRQARRIALDAIKNGLGAAQSALPQQAAPADAEAPEGVEPDVWNVMTPEERALWQ